MAPYSELARAGDMPRHCIIVSWWGGECAWAGWCRCWPSSRESAQLTGSRMQSLPGQALGSPAGSQQHLLMALGLGKHWGPEGVTPQKHCIRMGQARTPGVLPHGSWWCQDHQIQNSAKVSERYSVRWPLAPACPSLASSLASLPTPFGGNARQCDVHITKPSGLKSPPAALQ